jgi:uncharacterized protein YeaO (DUF488 family)
VERLITSSGSQKEAKGCIMLKVKRVYEKPSQADVDRFLVDRRWPRGVKKEDADLEAWLKDLAPSTELRRWFSHNPERWEEFPHR